MIDTGALATLWPAELIAAELPEPTSLVSGNPRQNNIDHDGGSMPTFNYPDEGDRAELAGRLYQAIDIETAIRAGRFGSLDELADWLAEQADLMNRVQDCRLWLTCPDQPRPGSARHAGPSATPRAFTVVIPRSRRAIAYCAPPRFDRRWARPIMDVSFD